RREPERDRLGASDQALWRYSRERPLAPSLYGRDAGTRYRGRNRPGGKQAADRDAPLQDVARRDGRPDRLPQATRPRVATWPRGYAADPGHGRARIGRARGGRRDDEVRARRA